MTNKLRTKIAASVTALATGLTLFAVIPATAADKVDGKTSETAAASCYEIKQNDPDSKSGSYWLYAPDMSAPAQFYCDQETDGGGWVMIGRGRDGWTEEYAGKGNPAELASNPDGTDAFTPVQLSSITVDALLNGQSPANLADGVRFKRAYNAAGSAWQESRATRTDSTKWSWALGATATWSNVSFQNPNSRMTNSGTSTNGIAAFDNLTRTMKFQGTSALDYKIGFAYGAWTYGTNSSTSYLWSKGGGNALPFTQVYLRPKLISSNLDYGQVADSGAEGSHRIALPNSYSAKMQWRTSEQTATGKTGEMNSYVQAITQVGNTVFVGGDYAYVQSVSGEQVQQPYLTGYDVNTGELVRTFVPKFNNQIKSLEALPNGLLAVGGEFTQVNGQDISGLVLLDPTTGEVKNDWNWKLENRVSGGTVSVKGMDVQGDYLYLGGTFTHLTGSAGGTPTYARNMARYNIKTGAIDWKFRPAFNGTVNGVSASEDGSTVYAAGYFGTVNNENAKRLAALNTADGSRKANWDWELSYPDARAIGGFQFDVQDAGSTVFTGGAEHIIAQYDASTFARRSSSITRDGGDFQDLHKSGNTIYGACHCGDYTYEGGTKHDNPWDQAHDVQQMRLVSAFDATTGAVQPEFNPQIRGASGNGIWESFVDTKGTLWVGGDINSSVGANGAQKTVGFARFNARDIVAPAVPTGLKVASADGLDKLTWNAVGNAKYQILRDNKVIATTDKPSYEAQHVDNARYFVRTVDAEDNFSATTPAAVAGVIEAPTAEPSTEAPVVEPTTEAPSAEPTAEAPSAEPTTEAPSEEPKPDDPTDTEKPVIYAIDNKVTPINEVFKGADANVTNGETVKWTAEGLPNGISIDPDTGWITGTPTEAGVFNVVIKATDLAGNVSDPLSWKIEVTKKAEPEVVTEEVVANGSKWNYQAAAWYTTTRWNQLIGFGYGWETVNTSIGWGDAPVTTRLGYYWDRPLAFYMRKDVSLSNIDTIQKLTLNTYADDGLVVYVNGQEVGRSNMPGGTVRYNTLASSPKDTTQSRQTPVTIEVPNSLLREGNNVIAVSVHSASRSSANVTFDMSAEVTR